MLRLGTCLPILGAVLIAPLAPKIRMHLYQAAHADIRVPVVLTMPPLLIGLLGPSAGALLVRTGSLS
ncbi:hypothetical protein KEH59_08385 [Burkholderia contaminans]|uniref:hypothetical protein n=1 Tax=Burkholderia contaminans TaxID=488447 RepID=UPI001BABAB51|nr:hypothetical protein [Burkholderia contaminans]QUN45728.1 hypothetical protein KEH59_08385 [Burkholderia contaminans]